MRKFLSLFAAILFAGSMMAEVGSLYYTFLPYKPASGAVSDYTKTGTMTIDQMDWTVPGNWYGNGELRLGGKSVDGDRTIIGQNAMGSAIAKIRIAHAGVTSDKIVLNSVTVTTASDANFTQNVTEKTVTGFTVAKNTKDTIDVVPATEPWAINSYYKIAFNLTNSQASNYSFIVEKILFYAYVAGGDPDPDPESTVKTIYCKCEHDWWKASGAAVGAFAWTEGGEINADFPGVRMTAVDGETDLWKIDLDLAKYENVIFARVNGSGDIENWGAQTADLIIPTDDKDLFTITSTTAQWKGDGNTVAGTWSKYEAGSTPEPPTPAEKDSIFFVNVPEWDNLRVHLWGGSAAATEWPGVEMTKLGDDDKVNDYDVYKFVADEGAYANCIFSNDGENQTGDLTWTSGKYFYDGAWYAKTEIPEPIPAAVPLQGNIWKVNAETPDRAGSHFVDEALLKVDGVYATTLKPNTRTIAGEEFTHVIQVRTNAYPSAENLVGTEKSGSTSLVITAKEDVDITLYYNRQVLNDTAIENDNKDLIVFDQAAITTKVTGEFTIDAYNSDKTYLNATKKVALKKHHIYTVTAAGTTLQLHGIKLEDHVPAMQIAGAWDVQEQAWVVNNMTLADNKLTASYEVELAKGDYEFKVLKDGAWLTKSNDGAYGLHREWPGVAGVTDQADNNLKLTADAAGTYTFTWTFANDSIGITFPDPEPVAKYYIIGAGEAFGEWAHVAVYEDSYEIKDLAAGSYMFRLTMAEDDWSKDYGYEQLTVKPEGVTGNGDNNICFELKEASDFKVTYKPAAGDEEAVFTVEANFYVPVKKDLFLVPNQWADGDAKIAAWVWNKDYSINFFSEFFAPKAEGNDTLVAQVRADLDSIIFVRFSGEETYPHWEGDYQLNQTPNDSIQWDKAIFTILPSEGYWTNGTWDVYTPEPPATFYITGNAALVGEDLKWNAQAVKATASTYTFVGLHANIEYLLKVIEDGNWDGGKVYGYEALTEKPEGLRAEGNDNIAFKLVEDGDVTITYYWAEAAEQEWEMTFKVEGNFYVPVKKDLYLVPNQWAEGEAKIAAWTWNKDYSINAFTEFFAPKAEGNDTLVAKVLAEADSIIFVRFNASATEPMWNGEEGYQWNQTPNDSIQWEKGVFTILPGEGYTTNGTWDVYTPAQPRLADGFYLIGQKGWEVDALDADMLFEANPDNEGEYQLTINLVKGEQIKVVKVESDVIKHWYPEEGDNYTIDAAHEGLKTIYFKPDYQIGWAVFGGHIYIEQNQATGLDSTAADAKAVKAMINGQLFIIRDGKTYTAQGHEVK